MNSILNVPLMFRPNSDTFRGILGFLAKTIMKAYTKLTVVMCCQIVARKSVVPQCSQKIQPYNLLWMQLVFKSCTTHWKLLSCWKNPSKKVSTNKKLILKVC